MGAETRFVATVIKEYEEEIIVYGITDIEAEGEARKYPGVVRIKDIKLDQI